MGWAGLLFGRHFALFQNTVDLFEESSGSRGGEIDLVEVEHDLALLLGPVMAIHAVFGEEIPHVDGKGFGCG
ncbi:MAG: hypothetical protein RLZZ399_1818 [Verrucomicrobiota bacterium]